jgi:biotin synthase
VMQNRITRDAILGWLAEQDEERLEALWKLADSVRHECVGDEVHLRGLIEFSNYCVRRCAYCGLRAPNRRVRRYRMTMEEVMDCVAAAVARGYGTVVLQSGEDYGITRADMCSLIARIKAETPLAVTLSLGERPVEDLAAWRRAGADRYLLRFETSNRTLYDRVHPPFEGRKSDRIALLRTLRELGYEAGGGVMVGLPGQTIEDLACDIETFRALDLDMIGIGPYLPHPDTPLGRLVGRTKEPLLNTDLMTCKVIALARLVCPGANIPSTTALATKNPAMGRLLGLARGANVVMVNLTPQRYRDRYEIYPAKARESDAQVRRCILLLGRKIGVGRGDSMARFQRAKSAACRR